MSVTARPYRRDGWEVDITLRLPNGARHRERILAPSPRSRRLNGGAPSASVSGSTSSRVLGPNPHLRRRYLPWQSSVHEAQRRPESFSLIRV